MTTNKPDCYSCIYQKELSYSCHSECANHEAKVSANPHGIKNGWFMWPINFDPCWLESCDGFSQRPDKEQK